MTRARRTLHVTGAHWYAENLRAKEAGPFLRELKDWVVETRHATWDPGADIDEEHNPILGYRERFVRDWPGRRCPTRATPCSPRAGGAPRRTPSAGGAVRPSLLEALDQEARGAGASVGRPARARAAPPGARGSRGVEAGEHAPQRLGRRRDRLRALSQAVLLDLVRPAPTVLGTRRADGDGDPSVDRAALHGTGAAPRARRRARPHGRGARRRAGPGGPVAALVPRQPLLGAVPLFAERAFLLRLEGFAVSGRIDAVFGASVEGPWEIVDWKTGRRPAADDPLAGLQLELYGLACVEVWGKRPEDLTLTYLYLADGDEVSHAMGDPDEIRARRDVAARDRRRGVRPDPGRLVPPLRLPVVLRRREGVDRLGLILSPTTPRDARPAPGTGGSSRRGRTPRRARRGRTAGPGPSRGTRTCATARNHSRSPGCRTSSPRVPGYRSDGSSTTTGVGAERVLDRRAELRIVGSTSARSPSQVADATAGAAGVVGADPVARPAGPRSAPGGRGTRPGAGSLRQGAIDAADHPGERREERPREVGVVLHNRRNEARGTRRSDSGVSATTDAEQVSRRAARSHRSDRRGAGGGSSSRRR